MTTGGLGWCLHLAYAKEPELAVATYLTGSVGFCLQNISFYYRPVKSSSIPNWIMFFSGGVLSGTGFGYCLRLAMQEHPKSTTVAYIVGSLGYIISNFAVYAAVMFENRRKKLKYHDSRIYYSAGEIFNIPKCTSPSICLVDGMLHCKTCKVYYGSANVKSKAERAVVMERREDFLRKMKKSLQEMQSKREKNVPLAIENICNGNGLYRVRKRDVEESKDEATQTESRRRMMGTQTQENMEIRLGNKSQLQVDAEDLHNGDHQPKKTLN